ncbi:carbon-nitrogen hydrolase family protein [Gordonia aurantiaca]|uniref:carbon-nitrogen hydrolase family protein n=1 Tax=Gordonia sp. B21 TaxID=3151852 RepID=UPI003266402A
MTAPDNIQTDNIQTDSTGIVTAGVLQLRPTADRDANLADVADLIDQAAARGVAILQLPELFSVPFVKPMPPDPDYLVYGESLDGPSNTMVQEKSREHGMTIISSIFEKTAATGVYHNTATIFVNGERRLDYRKSHLPLSYNFPEKSYFRPGDESPGVVDADGIGVSTIICYERHFPELARTAAVQGATVLGIPIASGNGYKRETFDLELKAHAVFNCMYVLAGNRIGVEGPKEYFGGSSIYGPDGETVATATDNGENELVVGDIDLGQLPAKRAFGRPFLRDRRFDLYK